MIREVVGALFAAFGGVMLLWMMLPMLTMIRTTVNGMVDVEDPLVAPTVEMGDMVYTALPWVVILVIGVSILAYSTRNNPYDQ